MVQVRYRLFVVLLSLMCASPLYASSTTKPGKKELPVEVVIKGSIVGADGKPLPIAHAKLWRVGLEPEHHRAYTNRQGAFQMKVKVRGAYTIRFYGLFHKSVGFPLILVSKQTISFRVRLSTLKPIKKLRPAYVIGAFNQWKRTGGKKMKLRKDGTFVLILPPQKKPFVYQVLGGVDNYSLLAGTQASRYTHNKKGMYLAVLPPSNKPITLVYNPHGFPRSKAKHKIDVTPKSIEVWRDLALRFQKKQRDVWKAYSKHRKAGKSYRSFKVNWDRELAYLYLQQAQSSDPFLRKYIQLFGYTLSFLNVSYSKRREWARNLIKEIPPTSPLWSLKRYHVSSILYNAGSRRKETKMFKRTMLEQHPNPSVRMRLLGRAVYRLMYRHGLYTQAIKQFPKHTVRRYLAHQKKKRKLRFKARRKAMLKRRAALRKKRLLQTKKAKLRKKKSSPRKTVAVPHLSKGLVSKLKKKLSPALFQELVQSLQGSMTKKKRRKPVPVRKLSAARRSAPSVRRSKRVARKGLVHKGKKKPLRKKGPASRPAAVKVRKKKRPTSRKVTKRIVAKKTLRKRRKRKIRKRKKRKGTFARNIEKVKKDPKYFLRQALSYFEQMKQLVKKYPTRGFKGQLRRARWKIYPKFSTGKKMKPFRLPLLDAKGTFFTEKDLIGKHTLFVFWATWCGPCVRKMPTLHKVRKMFGDDKLQMVSISLDRSLELVQNFRKKRWKIPWHNSILLGKDKKKYSNFFEIVGIPKMLLTGPKGHIVAGNVALRSALVSVLQQKLKSAPTSLPTKSSK